MDELSAAQIMILVHVSDRKFNRHTQIAYFTVCVFVYE